MLFFFTCSLIVLLNVDINLYTYIHSRIYCNMRARFHAYSNYTWKQSRYVSLLLLLFVLFLEKKHFKRHFLSSPKECFVNLTQINTLVNLASELFHSDTFIYQWPCLRFRTQAMVSSVWHMKLPWHDYLEKAELRQWDPVLTKLLTLSKPLTAVITRYVTMVYKLKNRCWLLIDLPSSIQNKYNLFYGPF